jgi:hypothetical protein
MERINRYLLTHYPLLWNTRMVWVLLANVVIHLLFFLSGLGAVDRTTIQHYYSPDSVSDESLHTIAALFSLVFIIVWCVFYLRNNAFKSFYRIGKWYPAKEFAILFLIFLSTICYAQSFRWGVRVGARNITNTQQLQNEISQVNQAMVYVPVEKVSYFVLNTCEARRTRNNEAASIELPDPEAGYPPGIDTTKLMTALRQPNAFSYQHYCNQYLSNRFSTDNGVAISQRNRQWLSGQHRDSVRQCLRRFFIILKKYGIDYRLDESELVASVFKENNFALSLLVPTSATEYVNGEEIENSRYVDTHNLSRVYWFLAACQPGGENVKDVLEAWSVYGYIALLLASILMCYRRFSRKVFLISVIGTLVWMILFGVMAANSRGATIPALLLFLCVVFLLGALFFLSQKAGKTIAGVLLNWHAYVAPFFILLMVIMFQEYYESAYSAAGDINEEWMKQRYPISHWVSHHKNILFLLGIPTMALYLAFAFNRWAKKWHVMPEE